MHLELSPCVLEARVLNHTTDSSLDFILAAITACVPTVQSHGNLAAEYSLMDFAPLVTCRGNIAFFKVNMK